MGYWDLIKAAHESVDIHDGEVSFLRDFSRLTVTQQLLFAAHCCLCELDNGGLDQFFYNPTGILVIEAVQGFRAIGLKSAAGIVQEAVNRFSTPYPRDRAERMTELNGVPTFEDLDDRFGCALMDFDNAAEAYAASERA